ncbi:hypothetical protein CCAX7_44180 [Capsulimonas corticalis]|uniref:Uncharacterized protein n=1 Tax=Capsulimonas corticalis TaxID=2219043 RepID=A0A402CX96_9BACT|nr:hypothetical protein [Capsulimonas corticalis]BDI32367.1 hypothetical protein CCAX7_44180 [Capsulimonas corticalis]
MRARIRLTALLALALLVLFGAAYPVMAAPRRAIIVLTPPATLSDWMASPSPTLHRLLETGQCALVNTRAARIPDNRGRESIASAALTLGSGARAACNARDVQWSFLSAPALPGVSAEDLFERRTLVRRGGLFVALNWPRIVAANQNLGYRISLGNLCASLHRSGVTVLATQGPIAPFVACDDIGTTNVIRADDFATPLLTLGKCSVIIDAPANWQDADRLLAAAIHSADEFGARLIVISPAVNDAEYARGERLAPMVQYETGRGPGLLTSRSTRTPGLVANTDFAPALAAYFGASLLSGQRTADFTVRPTARPTTALLGIQRRATAQRQGMKLLPYFAVAGGLIVVLALALRRRGGDAPWDLTLLPGVAIAAFALSTSAAQFGVASAILLTAALLLRRRIGPANTLRGLCGLIWLAGVIHMLAPHGLLKFSLLGYSIVEGARYYGIGNEMMGALAGAMLVAAAGAAATWSRRLMLALALATIGMIGWPQIGAKAGGVIVSVGTLLVYFGSLRGVRWSAGRAALVVAASLLAVLAVAFLDSHLNPGRQSHLGQAMAEIGTSGLGDGWDIITRKLAVEGHLLWHSAWAVPLWSALAGIFMSRSAVQRLNNVRTIALFNAGIAGVLLSIAFNDAGAVAGALCAMLLWSYLSLVTTGSKADPRSAFEPVSA